MSSPSPQKPKWSPGGAIRRTSTILSMGRKTPSRASSEHESDSSSMKPSSVPPSPTPKSNSPRTSLETASEDSTAGSPSKSKLARMSGALRRPSSLIPRRRTTSMASSVKDAASINSKAAPTTRSSTDRELAPQPVLTAEPDPFITAEADPTSSEPAIEARPLHAEPEHTPAPLVEAAGATGFTDEPEELVQEPLSLQSEGQPESVTLNTELVEPMFVEQTPLSAVEEEPPTPAILRREEVIPPSAVAESISVLPTAEQIGVEPTVEAMIEPITTAEPKLPESETDAHPAVTPSVDEAAISTQHEQSTSEPELIAHDMAIQELMPADHDLVVPEPLDNVASLNSSFEDLGASVEPTVDEVQKVVATEPSVLLTPVDEVLSSSDAKVEAVSANSVVTISSTKEETAPAKDAMPSSVATEQSHPLAAKVLPITEEPLPSRSLPLEIPAASVESAAPSPAATQPLLSLSEVQDLSTTRQQNGSLAPPRDRHQPKVPQEYRSVLRTLLDALLGLVRWWRRGHC